MIKFIFNIYKRFVYKKILNKILTIENENENVFVCNELEKYFFVKKEFLYFKEIMSSTFLIEQIKYKNANATTTIETNEYRIFILQLCIEMCK